ncbi:MAG: hypothetical protein EXS16_12305 [Gemmataceae bacterium]|nr:hypothetical protein [Gemmataceae bacterium]
MSPHDFPAIRLQLETRVFAKTGSQLRDLGIELSADMVRLLGQSSTYYVKQLAQHCVREFLPNVQLVNDISVA